MAPFPRVDPSTIYTLLERIGKGSFGVVHKGYADRGPPPSFPATDTQPHLASSRCFGRAMN